MSVRCLGGAYTDDHVVELRSYVAEHPDMALVGRLIAPYDECAHPGKNARCTYNSYAGFDGHEASHLCVLRKLVRPLRR